MRSVSKRSWSGIRTAALPASLAVAASCAAMSPPPPQRIHERILPADLYALLENVLMDPGNMITHRDANRGHFQTAQEPNGARIGAATVRE